MPVDVLPRGRSSSCTACCRYLHLLAHHFVSLLFAVEFIVLVLAAAFFTHASLVEVLLEIVASCSVHLIGYVSGDSALDVVEFAQTFDRNDALGVFLSLLLDGGLTLLHLLHLVLGEDV